jgi:hypothetical protein
VWSLINDWLNPFISPNNNETMGKAEVQEDGFTIYSQRWTILFGYATMSLMNAAMWITFAAIDDATAVFFNCSVNDVNMLALVFQILYFPGFLFALYIIEASSLRFSLIIGSGMGALGCILRAFAAYVAVDSPSTAYWICMLGQCLGAFSQPIFLSTAAVVSKTTTPIYVVVSLLLNS